MYMYKLQLFFNSLSQIKKNYDTYHTSIKFYCDIYITSILSFLWVGYQPKQSTVSQPSVSGTKVSFHQDIVQHYILYEYRAYIFKSQMTCNILKKMGHPWMLPSRHCWDNYPGTLSWIQVSAHDDSIKWKHFPRYWPFVRGIHRSQVNSPHKGQWRGALMFSLICALNKRLSKQSWGWWFETQSRSLWRCCNDPSKDWELLEEI